MTNMSSSEKRQYVWLIRYGATYPGLVENVGNFDSDLAIPEGYGHARAMGQRMASSSKNAPIKHVFSDPFLRCMRTGDLIVQSLNEATKQSEPEKTTAAKQISLKVEEGLTEWQVRSLLVNKDGIRTHPKTLQEHQTKFQTIDASYKSVNPQGTDRISLTTDYQPRFPENEIELHLRCKITLMKLLEYTGPSVDSIAIVSHAPCVQSMAMALEGVDSPAESKIVGPWSLGGMTCFSRPITNNMEGRTKWDLEFFSDTSHMPGEYQLGEKGKWSLPSFNKAKK